MRTRSVYYCNYSIGENAYEETARVCGRYGRRILLIGGEKGLAAGAERLKHALAGSGLEIVDTVIFGEDCTSSAMRRWAEYAVGLHADMIFGM